MACLPARWLRDDVCGQRDRVESLANGFAGNPMRGDP